MSYVENTAAAHIMAMDHLEPGSAVAGQVYFINELKPVNLWDWINDILTLVDLPPVRSHVSARLAYIAGGALEVAYSMGRIKTEPPMTRFVALQLSQSHAYSVDKAITDFNYQPSVTYDTGMQKLQTWLKEVQRNT